MKLWSFWVCVFFPRNFKFASKRRLPLSKYPPNSQSRERGRCFYWKSWCLRIIFSISRQSTSCPISVGVERGELNPCHGRKSHSSYRFISLRSTREGGCRWHLFLINALKFLLRASLFLFLAHSQKVFQFLPRSQWLLKLITLPAVQSSTQYAHRTGIFDLSAFQKVPCANIQFVKFFSDFGFDFVGGQTSIVKHDVAKNNKLVFFRTKPSRVCRGLWMYIN